jgi:hypothetical protein
MSVRRRDQPVSSRSAVRAPCAPFAVRCHVHPNDHPRGIRGEVVRHLATATHLLGDAAAHTDANRSGAELPEQIKRALDEDAQRTPGGVDEDHGAIGMKISPNSLMRRLLDGPRCSHDTICKPRGSSPQPPRS